MGEATELADVLRELSKLDQSTDEGRAQAVVLRSRQRDLMDPHTRCFLLDQETGDGRLVTVVWGIDGAALR